MLSSLANILGTLIEFIMNVIIFVEELISFIVNIPIKVLNLINSLSLPDFMIAGLITAFTCLSIILILKLISFIK